MLNRFSKLHGKVALKASEVKVLVTQLAPWTFVIPWTNRLLCPRNSSGKNTGVGHHFFLQWIFLIQGLNQVSCIAGRFFIIWATREAPSYRSSGSSLCFSALGFLLFLYIFLWGTPLLLKLGDCQPSCLCLMVEFPKSESLCQEWFARSLMGQMEIPAGVPGWNGKGKKLEALSPGLAGDRWHLPSCFSWQAGLQIHLLN